MFKISEGFKKEINKLQGRKFNAKVIIRNKEYSGNQIYEMNLEESVNPSDNFSIGTVCSNTFEIKLINTGDIFDNAIVKPYVGLYIGDDIEYIPLGVFTVIKTSVKGKFINLECVDNMLGLEKVYFSDLSYPADINDIAKEICKKAGVNLASKLPNYRVNKIEGYSLREAIGFIASLCGSFARFNRIGDLEIRGYEVVKQEMTPHNLFKLDIEANECIIKKVIAKKGEEELSTGTDDGNKIVFNNPIITKEILSDIYTKYNGFKYIPYTAKWKGNPAIMAGDILNLTDLKGNKYNALIMEQKFTYKNGISSEVKAKGKTRQDSSFDSKGSVTQSMERYSIEQANIKKALIDKASINDLTAVDAKIQRLYTEDLTAIRAEIVNLNSKKANILELNSLKATLQQAIITKADITDLNSAVGKINVLESKTASIDNLLSQKASINDLNALNATISEALIKKATIAQLEALETKTNNLIADKANITDLNVINANINKVQTETANIKTLLNGNLSSENIQAGGITSDKLVIANGFIKDAMIDSISVNKLNAGIFTTDKFNIRSKDGNLIIKDNTIQIKDSSKVRVQIGKDASGDYSLYVWDKLGNLMFNALGITKDAIKDKIIRNDMVSDDAAIEGKKLNIESVIREVNNGKSNLKASKIDIDTKGQTLDIAFSNLVTENGKNKEEIVSLITKLNVQQGQISASIENSKVLEGKQKTLEDNYNRTVVTVDSLKNTVGQQKTLIDSATGKITSVEVKANTLEKNLSGLTQTVTDTKKVIENNKTVLESKNAELKANIDSVSSSLSSVSSTVDKNNKTLVAKTNTLEQNLNGLTQRVESNKTVTDGKITSVENEAHELKAGLGGLTSKLDTLKSTTDGINKTVSNQGSVINQLKDSINLKVDSSTFTQSTQTINNNITRAKEQAIIEARSIPDTRSNNESPSWYMQHYAFQTITEFKYANVIGVPNGGSWFGTLETTVPWNNSSGGYPTQVFRSNSSPTYQRHGINETTWSSWEQIEDTQGSQAKANNALSNAKSYSDSKKQEAIKAAENLALEKSNLAKKYADEVATAKANLAQANAIANADGKITEEERKRIQQAQENLNTAISKADKAKQDAINEANRVAELKKQEAISSANSHADNKANEALNNAKAFVNSEITNVNTHLNKNTSEINILKGQIESKVSQSDIDKSIQNIKFNDVNMISNSGEFKGTDHWSCTNGSNNLTIENSILKFKFTNYANWGCYISNDSLRNKPLETSKEYTVVCRLKASRNQTLSFNICDGDSNNHVYARDLNITTEWKIFKFTFKPASIGNERQFRFITGNLGYDFDFYIEFVKMVEGATSSDSWSMAPDYVLDNIKTVTDKITTVESKLTQENNSIKASVQDLNSTTQTITTNVSNINRDLTSKINSNLDAAKSFATDIAIAKANLAKEQAIANADGKITAEEQKRIQQAQDNLNAAISKATEAEIKAKSYADVKKQEAINSANNNTANTINNLDIGIYNLANESGNFLDNTGFFVANGGTLEIDSSNTFREYNTLKIKGNSGACYKDYIELQGNTTYCYSCWIKSDRIIPLNVSTPLHMWVTESKEDDVCHREIILKYSKEINSNWQQVFIIFKTPSNKDKYIMKPFIYGIGEATVWLANFQVKKGSILNDWTPNPNDLKRYSEEVAKAKAELAKQQAIANADGKITEEERKRIQQAQENLNVAIARADKAKQEAINSANSHADSKANEALNNAKAYTNAEITTVNSKVHNVESNLNILSDRINTKVSQSDIDKAVTTLRIERIIYARGTGNDYPANSIVKVNGKTITDGQGRGLRINALNKITLERVFLEDYDTYGDGNAINNFANKINELNNGDYIIIVTSQDASYPLNSTVKNALEKIGATLFDNKQGTYREAYALIGKSKLGRGNGIEMFIPRTETDKRFAEVSVKVGEDGTFIGVNSNNMGLEATLIKSNISDVSSSVTQLRDSVTTDIRAINSKTQSIETTLNGKASKQEVTEVNNRVATIKASLDSITQRVSSTESKTQTLESNINGKASKQEIVSINNKVASIETSLSGITNRVSSTESKTSSLEVSINSTNSELNILKNSISTKLEKIDSHIKYGSTNLLINTEFLNNFYNWNKNQYVGLDKYQEKDYVGVMIQNNRIGTEGTLWQRATLKTEVTYTLSFEEYTDDISRWWVGIYYKLNGATKYITLFDSSVNKHSWQKRVFQFKLPSGATETDVSFYNYGGSVGRVWVCNLQLEEGEFATPYKSNPLDFSKFSSAITQTVEGINTEVSKKVNGRDIISTINQSAESVKINASRINLQGYVTVGDLGSTNVTTINNAHITSGTIEGRTMIALNGTGKQNGVLTVNNGESYLEYFRCREAWMMSPYANGWRVPLVHSKYGIKDNESSSDMIDEIAFYRGTDGRNYLQITNTKTGRVEYIELYRSAFDTVTILNRLDRIDAKLAGL
ncbi:interleukin-like EMT inducer domain-containing protein [Clostridium perfringens]|uniref:interleukin-like EMT inducer domain-containing protein n=1 Tax=Clostridium perfringens TaxID=1502 RepID=UPI003F43692D